MSKKTIKNNLLIFLLSALFILFGAFCIFLAIIGKKSILFVSAFACLLVTLTMNLADKFNVNKHNLKTINIITAVLDIIAIPLVFLFNIFSLAFSIPAFILSNKAKGLGKNRLSLGIYIVSLLLIVASLLYAVISLI